MNKLSIKSKKELDIMREGGRKLSRVKHEVSSLVRSGVSAYEIEEAATNYIEKLGCEPSFKMVPGYKWSTCVNVNEGVVHGIPKKDVIFRDGDVVSIDLGIFYKGFHTDTSVSLLIGDNLEKEKFLEAGRTALSEAISSIKLGGKIGDISYAIEKTITSFGYTPLSSLTGHGIGRRLHEDPRIPCILAGTPDEFVEIKEGMALAVEVMYTMGRDELVTMGDGWTISTKDAKISALFEETVAVYGNGHVVLTE